VFFTIPSASPPTVLTVQPRCWGGLVNEHAIEPHIPVFDKSARDDGTFSREDFAYDQERDLYAPARC
jgi:hypothetical protein